MTRSTNENEDEVLTQDQIKLPLADEGNCSGDANGTDLKKGPWTASEDAILIDYVKKHGEGNWNAVQKHSGLSRCGKSCRLRWANHLRPNLKKGAFTQEEEQLIIELHAKMGNKWAHMAAHLPGRTDNEIKNYWNTRIKRRQRAGLPLYPPEVSFQALRDCQRGLNISRLDVGDKGQHDIFQIPDVMFDDLKSNQAISPYIPELPDIPGSSMLVKGLASSQYNSFMLPTIPRQKRLRESPNQLSVYRNSVKDEFPMDNFGEISCDKAANFLGSFPFDPNPPTSNPQYDDNHQGSHALLIGNFSASKPISGAVKLELPSLQYPDSDLGGWTSSSSSPSLHESIDTFIQSPSIGIVESNYPSPRNSGLLDTLLHEAKMLSSTNIHSSDKSSNSSTVTLGDIVDNSTLNICDTKWDNYTDPLSPLGRTATSVFGECTPISTSGSSLDDQQHSKLFTGRNAKPEPGDQARILDREKQTSNRLDITRPDALLASDWHDSGHVKDKAIMTDAIAALLGDDHSSNYKEMAAGAFGSSQGWGQLGSCMWKNMPAVCQMYELP